ncbi:hypothetical protein HP439_02845 [Sphingobacterium shayense]|uniref:hypothetical protein n=1 Tax=Sphingobacterium shayense TaxID=626343 RepID=UPI001557D1C5|nr:hypothetical protein [Sphingobacterium shayense]NQD69659.1 hypothetical protein [Sphingobacterium shayense]
MKNYFRGLFLCTILALLSISCEKDTSRELQPWPSDYLELTRAWYRENGNLVSDSRSGIDPQQFIISWDEHGYIFNRDGDSVIYIPIKSENDSFYREINLVKNEFGEPFGVIKEYVGNPSIENTLLNIYSGSGFLLERAKYNYKSGRMQYILAKKHSADILANIKNKISCSGCTGSFADGYEIEEVVVTGYTNGNNYDDQYNSAPEIPSIPGVSGGGGGNGSASSSAAAISELKNKLFNKPFALIADIPCELIKEWVQTAKHRPHQQQIDKLKTIKATPNIVPWLNDPIIARVQAIEDAYSTVVNMDYFPVTIDQLPIINGVRQTPEQMLNYIRKNLNDFVDTNRSKFTPYQYYGIDDVSLWNSSNPINAVIGIDIGGWLPDNGAVIVSNYTPTSWTFTTVNDPKFNDHPVSGNRDFGYQRNADGSFTFYTRGVDRLTNYDASWIQDSELLQFMMGGSPFGQADALWRSFQDKISNFVNKNKGKAKIDMEQIHRPDWELLEKIIKGKASLILLSNDC